MVLNKKTLTETAQRIMRGERIEAAMLAPFLAHEFPELSPLSKLMLRVAAWISLFFASVLVIFPEVAEWLIAVLPGFFLLPERLAKALDYVWGLVGQPVKKQHLMYHLPNIIIYTFGVAGLRQLWRRIHKNNWKDRVRAAQDSLRKAIEDGTARLRFNPGFSVLIVGNGDQVGKSLAVDNALIGPTFATNRPPYTSLWVRYVSGEGDEALDSALDQINSEDAGEYVLFPVVDDQLFLPEPHEYDIPPHRVDLAVKRIRAIERRRGMSEKRIVIVGDKEQSSRFVTASMGDELITEADEVSLQSIAEAEPNVIIADPTEITLNKIIAIAGGRRIYFRASERGAEKYVAQFYRRLAHLNYVPTSEDILIVGYDINDLETEHQIMSQHHVEYLPVILSRDLFDLLSKTYLAERDHIFVPHLVRDTLKDLVAET